MIFIFWFCGVPRKLKSITSPPSFIEFSLLIQFYYERICELVENVNVYSTYMEYMN